MHYIWHMVYEEESSAANNNFILRLPFSSQNWLLFTYSSAIFLALNLLFCKEGTGYKFSENRRRTHHTRISKSIWKTIKLSEIWLSWAF